MSSKVHWYSALQFGLSALTVSLLWSLSAGLAFAGVAQRAARGSSAQIEQILTISVAVAFCGVLLMPSAGFALWRLIGKPTPHLPLAPRWLLQWLLILVFPLVLLAGHFISRSSGILWLVLPFLNLLAIGLPIAWLLYLAGRDLPTGSPQRLWGVFGSGMALAPLLILICEALAGLAMVALAAAYISRQPGLSGNLQSLLEWMATSNPTPEALLKKLAPLLASPAIILAALIFGAVVVPLIEELIKPVGVWLLIGRNLSEADGFVAGAISGAGYALFESLSVGTGMGVWTLVVIGRAGTAIVHIFTTALSGWALAGAWRDGQRHWRYLRLGAVYLLAVMIHGLWNGLTLVAVLTELIPEQSAATMGQWFIWLGSAAPYGLGALAAGIFTALLWVNRLLWQGRQAEKALATEPPAPDENAILKSQAVEE